MTTTENREKAPILGSNISVWNLDETVSKLRELCQSGGTHYVCVSNVHTVVMGAQDHSYAEVTNKATMATADGVPLIWASRVLTGPKIHGRASGPDILAAILSDPGSRHLRHFFFGSTHAVLDKLRMKLEKAYPDAKLVDFFSPPMRPARRPDEPLDAAELEECARIDDARPDIVWVGLGAPKQEVWMYRARQHLKTPVLIGVGAAFDFLAGNKKRAPMWMQRLGLEWAYRLAQEPRRLASRYFSTNPVFVASVAKQALRERMGREPHARG